MKTIGLIGGMSWQSSIEYYRIINEAINNELGKHHSAKSIMYSVDLDYVLELQHKEEWQTLAEMMVDAAKRLEDAGCDFVLICANTMHITADEVQKNIKIPLLHIADTTGQEIKSKGMKKIGLMGTPFTMEREFYKGRLKERYGIEVIVPDLDDRKYIYDVICEELDFGVLKESSRKRYIEIMEQLVQRGAEGIILGCTEIPLLVKQEHTNIPVFDTTMIHALSAVRLAIE